MRALRFAACLSLAVLLVLTAPLAGRAPLQIEELVARATPAIVLVNVTLATGGEATGSGVVFDTSGYILTNHHVVEGATEVRVTLSNRRSYPATVVDYKRVENSSGTQHVDVAVLKIAASGLATLPLRSDKPVRDGQEVLVLGYPGKLPLDRMSVTKGIVAAVRDGWIETDAVIVPGNSGGPMIDVTGRVIGLATFITGYNLRFGGAMWIEDAAVLAARALDPAAVRSRVVDVPGLEYFMPRDLTSLGYSVLHQKVWTGRDAYGGDPEEIESVGDYNGARRYASRRVFGQAVIVGTNDAAYVDSEGLYWIGDRIDSTWVRRTTDPVPRAMLPLRAGASWDHQEQWRRSPVTPDRPTDRIEPSSAAVDETSTVESLKDLVTVPAGTFRDCVRIRRDQIVRANDGTRERRVVTTWYAAGVGPVKKAYEISRPGGIERDTSELRAVRWIR